MGMGSDVGKNAAEVLTHETVPEVIKGLNDLIDRLHDLLDRLNGAALATVLNIPPRKG